MIVVLFGLVAITERDGLGYATPIAEQVTGQFIAEVGQRRFVDGAAEGEVEALIVSPEGLRSLLIGESELGVRLALPSDRPALRAGVVELHEEERRLHRIPRLDVRRGGARGRRFRDRGERRLRGLCDSRRPGEETADGWMDCL